jgi:hypothetical protein
MSLISQAHAALMVLHAPQYGISVLRSDRPRSPDPVEKKKVACADVRGEVSPVVDTPKPSIT